MKWDRVCPRKPLYNENLRTRNEDGSMCQVLTLISNDSLVFAPFTLIFKFKNIQFSLNYKSLLNFYYNKTN